MAATLILHPGSDMRLLVTGVATRVIETGDLLYLDDSAMVEVTVVDRGTQEALGGETWPLALTYITGSQGHFHVPLRDSLEVTVHQPLDILLTMDNGVDQHRSLRLPCLVTVDRG